MNNVGKTIRRLASFRDLLCKGQIFRLAGTVSGLLLPKRVFAWSKTIFYRLDSPDGSNKTVPDSVRVVCGGEESVRSLVRDLYEGDPSTLAFYESFYREGAEPWIAESDGTILGVVWLFTGSYLSPWEGYDGWLLRIGVEPTAKFVANVFVDPKSRGRGVFPLIIQACREAYPDGEFYSCVAETNDPSIGAHEKIGFRRIGAAYYLRFFNGTRCLFRPKRGKSRFLRLKRGIPADISLLRGSCKQG